MLAGLLERARTGSTVSPMSPRMAAFFDRLEQAAAEEATRGPLPAVAAMQKSDLLITLGARFDDRVIGNPKHFAQISRKIIHIDIDPSSISKIINAHYPIVGDLTNVLSELYEEVKGEPKNYAPWREILDRYQKIYNLYHF